MLSPKVRCPGASSSVRVPHYHIRLFVIQLDAMFSQAIQFTLIFKYHARLVCPCIALTFSVVVATELIIVVLLTLWLLTKKTCTECSA